MNRSILIVICDFLVLSAMSLSMGLSKTTSHGPGVTESVRPVTHTFLLDQLEKALLEKKETAGENSKLNEEIKAATDALKRLREDLEKREKRLENMEKALSGATDSMTRQQLELEAARKRAEELAKAVARTEGTLSGTQQVMKEQAKQLDAKEKQLKTVQMTLLQQQALLKVSEEELAKKQAELAKSQQTLTDRSKELTKALLEVEQHEAAIKANEKIIAEKTAQVFQAELLAMERKTKLEETEKQRIAATAELDKTKGLLEISEEERSHAEGRLARLNEENDALRKSAATREVLLQEQTQRVQQLRLKVAEEVQKGAELRVSLAEHKTTIHNQQAQLNDKEKLLVMKTEEAKTAATKLQAKDEVIRQTKQTLTQTEADLKKANELLRNDALSSYAKATAEVRFTLTNDRLFNSFDLNETYYLPRITLGGKVFLPGAFEKLTGLTDQRNGYTTVNELKYTIRKPGTADNTAKTLAGPILMLGEDLRACLIELPGEKADSALPVFTAAALRKRGLQDLTLFKANRYGEESALLDGRCSMRPNQDHYLLIRNSLRSSSEVPAEVGDLVIAKEGRLAGIIVRVITYPTEGRADAICFIFPSAVDLGTAKMLPVNRQAGPRPFAKFVETLNEVRKEVMILNRKKAE